jgi:glycosyltransferase involved in cell wall biosynthesis
MIGVVVPAHNEQACLDATLAALKTAARHPSLRSEPVCIVVVLDACSDGSRAVVQRHAGKRLAPVRASGHCVSYLEIDARNVGLARATGANLMLARGARWLAFTDADTIVAPGWLAAQLSLGVDVVCGSVAVEDWSAHKENAPRLRERFAQGYMDADGHRHIHGANLGVSAAAYQKAGGFSALPCHEDVALVAALASTGASFAWSAAPRVATSARTDARARGGFGDTLLAQLASLG